MPVIRLIFRTRAAIPAAKDPRVLTSTDLSRGYFPRRGLLYSILIHELALIGLLNLPDSNSLLKITHPPARAVIADRLESAVIMWLPVLNDSRPGMLLPAAKPEARHEEPPAASPPSKEGLSYPGPQPILSDFPNPTNFIQTVLEPTVKDPPTLRPPLLLPNFVLTEDAGLVQPPTPPDPVRPADPQPAPPPAVKPIEQKPAPLLPVQPAVKLNQPTLPPLKPAMPAPTAAPKLVMPVPLIPDPIPPVPPPKTEPPPTQALPPKAEPPRIEPPARPIAPPPPAKHPVSEIVKPPASPPQSAETLKEPVKPELPRPPVRVMDLQKILALTPMPAQPESPLSVPAGEALGRFAISPKPNLAASTTEPGAKLETPPPAVGAARPTVVPAANAANSNTVTAAAGTGAIAGAAKDKDSSNAGAVAPAAPGSGLVVISGPGTNPGSGKGNGSNDGAFAGITIIGGTGEAISATNATVNLRPPRPLQTAYDVTVISTENSGGGLPSFGVFSEKQIYTVYLDMRQTETDTAPLWTLEFAVLSDPVAQANAAGSPSRNQQGLVLPFPAVKEQPALPTDLVRKYAGKMVIVYAIVNLEGKLEQISVKNSPDPLLNGPVLSALSKWLFRPARLDGDPVAAIVLLGIPLSLPE